MKIEQINSRRLFGDFGPRAPEMVPEGLKLLAGLALTCWIPTAMFCLVLNQSVLLYGMLCDEALGALFGILIYKTSSNRVLSCVPVHHIPDVPSDGDLGEMKKAA